MNPNDFSSDRSGHLVHTQTDYWAFIPAPLPPDIVWSPELVSQLSMTEQRLAKLAALTTTFQFPGLLIQPFIRAEAVMSSRIEGTRATLSDVYRYESTRMPLSDDTSDVREVYNYVRALDFGLERIKTFPISLRLMRELHAILLEGVRGSHLAPGEFRRSQNWIGPPGSTINTAPYVPPPVEEMHVALDAMEKYIHQNTKVPGLVRIALIHYQFAAIHPFLDGNGRVGRLLNVLLMCDWKLLTQPLLNLSAYFERYRQEYYDRLLAVSQRNEWQSWLTFFLRGVGEQANSSVYRLERLSDLYVRYVTLVIQSRNRVMMTKMLDLVFSRPVLTINQIAAELHVPFNTARRYAKQFEVSGLLREATGNARNRVFHADEVLNIAGDSSL